MESFEQGELPTGVPNYTIIGTDHDSYAAVYSCKQLGPMNFQKIVLLTRERQPSQDVIAKATEQIALSGPGLGDLPMLNELQNCPDSFYANPNE